MNVFRVHVYGLQYTSILASWSWSCPQERSRGGYQNGDWDEGTGKEKEREGQEEMVRYDQGGYQELGPLWWW